MTQKLIVSSLCYAIGKKKLIDSICVEFSSGILHGILGPNGSGKSTLLRTLVGLWRPTSGAIFWNSESLLDKDRQTISRMISFVPQHSPPVFGFLVEDFIAMGLYPHHCRYWSAKKEASFSEALDLTDVQHLRYRRIDHLSHGERQRVYIARALVTQSPILLLDEPTASLDIPHQFNIWQLLQVLAEKGKIVIVTTHDLAIARRFCHRISLLHRGQCMGTGIFDAVMTPATFKEAFGIAMPSF